MTNSNLSLRSVDVEFTIYGVRARSIKSHTLRVTTGGMISFPSDRRVTVTALANVDLDVHHGERVGLVGHNGAGKTTLLRVMAGVYEPVRGRIERRGRVTPLFDLSSGFSPEATGLENIVIRGMYLGLERDELMARRGAIADFTELGAYLHMPVNTYSAGMLMRLAFAVSTAVEPEILLMDEWLAVGDAGFVKKAQQRLLDLVGSSGILVIASHSLGTLESVCNRLVWLDAGRVRADGPVKTVKAAFLEATGEPSVPG